MFDQFEQPGASAAVVHATECLEETYVLFRARAVRPIEASGLCCRAASTLSNCRAAVSNNSQLVMGHWTISPFVLLFAVTAVVAFETLGIVQQMRRGIPNSNNPETFGGLPYGDVFEFPKPSAGSRLTRIHAGSHPPGNDLLA
ncbi:hypothetical protein [Rhodoplanes sp. Z2-YC6860]|uniref:hypothetical protein n=1 Tax=Rhodoplanes sp. Z2-YC6860 TaxID=674703 RepID=UPI0008313EBD|nr:hypothetical protein [Rhodoplanes sp. Z2-YC6860]